MKCYICDHTPPPAAIRYDVPEAIGICQDCGIGVCASHSYKDTQPASPLLCIQCASLSKQLSFPAMVATAREACPPDEVLITK